MLISLIKQEKGEDGVPLEGNEDSEQQDEESDMSIERANQITPETRPGKRPIKKTPKMESYT